MTWQALATGISTIALADTGSGGLLHSTTPLVTGFYMNFAPQTQEVPYAVCLMASETETKVYATSPRANEYLIQFSVWTDVAVGLLPGQAIVDRIRTLFDRVAPTVSGFTCSQMMRTGGDVSVDDEYIHHVEQYAVVTSKA